MCGGENDRPEARPPRAVRGDATSGGGRTILRGDEKEEPDMPSLPNTVREVRLKSRPQGMPAPANFEIAETPTPVPGEGQMLIRPVFMRSEEHTSELQSLMRISYAVFCLKHKTQTRK